MSLFLPATSSSQAADMRALVWNSELEAVAQRWADQCTFGHDSVIIIFFLQILNILRIRMMIMLMIMMSQLVKHALVSVLWVMIRWFNWLSTGSYDDLDYDQDNVDGYHDEPWFNDADGDSNDYDSCDDSSGLWLSTWIPLFRTELSWMGRQLVKMRIWACLPR